MTPTQCVFIESRGPFEFTDADFVADAGPRRVVHMLTGAAAPAAGRRGDRTRWGSNTLPSRSSA